MHVYLICCKCTILRLSLYPFGELVLDIVVHVYFAKTFGELVLHLVVHVIFTETFGKS